MATSDLHFHNRWFTGHTENICIHNMYICVYACVRSRCLYVGVLVFMHTYLHVFKCHGIHRKGLGLGTSGLLILWFQLVHCHNKVNQRLQMVREGELNEGEGR